MSNGDAANQPVIGPATERQRRSEGVGLRGRGTPKIDIFDTTLRDGAQFEGISLTVEDKLRIAEQLEWLGVRYIEGGYPQANPKDAEFFTRATSDLELRNAELVAFGSTRRPRGRVDDDTTLRAVADSGAPVACIVGKSSEFHVTDALGTSLDEGVAMVADSVEFLKHEGMRVFFDAEHFFDGYKAAPEFSLRILEAAAVAGAEVLVLCDTNGGSLPHEVERITREVRAHFDDELIIGIHTQNDTGCAVANSIAAVVGGATHVQGTINGYGERTGNANLITCIPNLELKLGLKCLPDEHLGRLTAVSRHVAELVNLPPHPADPYVGNSAFAHKGGLHTSALGKVGGSAYEHVDPAVVGNHTRVLVSDLGGRSGMNLKAAEFGLDLDGPAAADLSKRVNELEAEGYVFEAADASLELLMREALGWTQDYFRVEAYRVTSYHREGVAWPGEGIDLSNEATVKVWVGDDRRVAVGEGNGPVNALDAALRNALNGRFPALVDIHLVDYRVRVLDSATGTGAVTRVLIDSTDGDRTWSTIGVSENVIESSWEALVSSLVYGLLHAPG